MLSVLYYVSVFRFLTFRVGVIMGQQCEQKCETYARVCGFFTPINNWNKGKKEEFYMRKTFQINEASRKIGQEEELDKLKEEIASIINKCIIDINDMDTMTAVTTLEKQMLGVCNE